MIGPVFVKWTMRKHKIMKRFALLLVMGLNLLVANSQTKLTFVVHEESKPCRRMMEQTCLQIQRKGSKTWELFYENIKGFEFVAGYRYVIEVIETPRPEPVPQDLSKNMYSLSKIISKTPVFVKLDVSDYQVMRLNGKDVSSNAIMFGFDSTFTNLVGFAGCNRFSIPVSFNSKKSKMITKAGVATKMSCGDVLDKLENEVLNSLNSRKFKVTKMGDLLILKFKGKEIVAFMPVLPMPPVQDEAVSRPEKTAWNYFNGRELRLIQMDGVTQKNSNATLLLDADNKGFSGNNGCNRMNGTLVTDRNKVWFKNIITTKMMCADVAATTEQRIMEIFRMDGLTVDFAEHVLNIYDPSGKLVLMYAVVAEK